MSLSDSNTLKNAVLLGECFRCLKTSMAHMSACHSGTETLEKYHFRGVSKIGRISMVYMSGCHCQTLKHWKMQRSCVRLWQVRRPSTPQHRRLRARRGRFRFTFDHWSSCLRWSWLSRCSCCFFPPCRFLLPWLSTSASLSPWALPLSTDLLFTKFDLCLGLLLC